MTRQRVRSSNIAGSFPKSKSSLAQHAQLISVPDVNGEAQQSFQLPLSSTISYSKSGPRDSTKEFDPNKQLSSKRRKKADSNAVPICMLGHLDGSSAILFDDSKKISDNRSMEISDQKEVEVSSHSHESSGSYHD